MVVQMVAIAEEQAVDKIYRKIEFKAERLQRGFDLFVL